jgi:hypothetical protein
MQCDETVGETVGETVDRAREGTPGEYDIMTMGRDSGKCYMTNVVKPRKHVIEQQGNTLHHVSTNCSETVYCAAIASN